jgi:hypothetical protein
MKETKQKGRSKESTHSQLRIQTFHWMNGMTNFCFFLFLLLLLFDHLVFFFKETQGGSCCCCMQTIFGISTFFYSIRFGCASGSCYYQGRKKSKKLGGGGISLSIHLKKYAYARRKKPENFFFSPFYLCQG